MEGNQGQHRPHGPLSWENEGACVGDRNIRRENQAKERGTGKMAASLWHTVQNSLFHKQSYPEQQSESRSVVSNSLLPHGVYSPWNSPGQNTGVRSCSFLQGIFPTQGSNPGLPHRRRILYQLSHKSLAFHDLKFNVPKLLSTP